MKYYYGDSMKDALGHDPVEITRTEDLIQYQSVYSVVIPASEVQPELPNEVDMEIDSCLADAVEDKEYVEQVINDYLSDTYGYLVAGYKWAQDKDKIHITNIEWETN